MYGPKKLYKLKHKRRSRKHVKFIEVIDYEIAEEDDFGIFLTLKLRGYQRKENLTMIKTELRNKYPEQLFNYIEEKSKREDLYLLIGTNVVVLTIILGFDRFGVFEETDDTIKANKEKIKKGIGIFI